MERVQPLPCADFLAPSIHSRLNSSNQLGQLTAQGVNAPNSWADQNGSAVSTTGLPAAGGQRFVQVVAGGYHTCGLTALAAGGETFCWGVRQGLRRGDEGPAAAGGCWHVRRQASSHGRLPLRSRPLHACAAPAACKLTRCLPAPAAAGRAAACKRPPLLARQAAPLPWPVRRPTPTPRRATPSLLGVPPCCPSR